MEEDYKHTLIRLAEMGYTHIEGGIYGGDPKSYARFASDTGLRTFATGDAMHSLLNDPAKAIRNAEALQAQYIVCYYPYLGSSEHLGRAEGLQAAANLNKLGLEFKTAGFTLAWHNHAWEFKDLGTETLFDVIMHNVDPELVKNELDLYWVIKGNADPVALFKKYPGRFELVHAKDMDYSEGKGMTCLGEGIIDFKRIFAHAETAGIKRIIIENEQWTGGLECAATSIKSFKQLF